MRRICSSSMPTVTNSASRVRLSSSTPSAPYRAPTSSVAASVMRRRTRRQVELGGDDHHRVQQAAQLFDPGVLVGRHAPMVDGRPSRGTVARRSRRRWRWSLGCSCSTTTRSCAGACATCWRPRATSRWSARRARPRRRARASRSPRPDVAVLDVRLPDGSGVEVCREHPLRAPDLRCLMLTSFDDDEALFDAIVAGASGYVLKEVRGADIVERSRVSPRRDAARPARRPPG